MITRLEEARLRDAWCVELLQRTSPAHVLGRLWADVRAGVPAYDPVPTPTDGLTERCACGNRFAPGRRAPRLYCSPRCRWRASRRRYTDRHAPRRTDDHR